MSPARDRGQALPALLGGLLLLTGCAIALAWVGAGLLERGERRRGVDLAALAGARALADLRPRLLVDASARAAVLARAEQVAREAALANGVADARVSFDAGPLPAEVRVVARGSIALPGGVRIPATVRARAQAPLFAEDLGDGQYRGPFAQRDGHPMRPDVALAYDRMAVAAARDGHRLVVVSGFRTYDEQAALFAAHPNPKWVAPPGRSLHRLGTELDLGPVAAYGWLLRHAGDFGFLLRYPWEPWHYGFTGSPASASVGFRSRSGGDGAVPSYVPARFAPALRRAASRWGVGAALLAAQLQVESGFAATPPIEARARRLRDLLRRLGSVPLALAATHAGLARVAACMCIPPIAQTRSYVRRVLVIIGGGDLGGARVRLIE